MIRGILDRVRTRSFSRRTNPIRRIPVCTAMPSSAAAIEVTLPESEVVAPRNTAPVSASPARVVADLKGLSALYAVFGALWEGDS